MLDASCGKGSIQHLNWFLIFICLFFCLFWGTFCEPRKEALVQLLLLNYKASWFIKSIRFSHIKSQKITKTLFSAIPEESKLYRQWCQKPKDNMFWTATLNRLSIPITTKCSEITFVQGFLVPVWVWSYFNFFSQLLDQGIFLFYDCVELQYYLVFNWTNIKEATWPHFLITRKRLSQNSVLCFILTFPLIF